MTVQLRDMHTGDIPVVAGIWHSGWHDGHAKHVPAALTRLRTLASMTERLPPLVAATRVAEMGAARQVAGFCMVKGAELYQMYAAPQARGSGLAAQLLAEGEARIKAAGHARAHLDCAIGNARAARFYEKNGWINTGEALSQLDTSQGTFALTLWRFEKPLQP